jgi:subtilisin family serine protease
MRRQLRRFFPIALLLCLGLGGPAIGITQETPVAVGTTFVIRANPDWADQVNSVLARVANPIEVTLSPGVTASELAQRLCGAHATSPPTPSEKAPNRIRLTPCVRIRTNVEVKVQAGNTLEGIAVRNGLLPSEGRRLKVMSGKSSAAHAITPEGLKIGDVVKIPEVPSWTTFSVQNDIVPDRKSLIDAIGKAVKCPQGIEDGCLLNKGIYVLEGGAAKKQENKPPAPLVMRDMARTRSDSTIALVAAMVNIPSVTRLTRSIPVAAYQWPYDVNLLAAVLQDLHEPFPTGGVVGVADGGLADAFGGPLPNDLYDQNEEDELGIGAGIKRDPDELMETGDVSLCGSSARPHFAEWDAKSLEVASHGSVVVSLAGALRVRQLNPILGKLLPRVVFYRMVPKVCSPDAGFDPGAGTLVSAFEYLERRADIINISYMTSSGDSSKHFVAAMQGSLVYSENLLVLPSGNDIPGNLDENLFCPQCLGSNDLDKRTANRTIVVGAATRELMRSAYSNYGNRTVSLYAPGEPIGALDVAGQNASGFKPATSYAAPYVALAAAILRSFGYKRALDIKDRLVATTWPLDETPARIGVVDLAKVIAVRHDVVEVVEPSTDGPPVRTTYVGKLLQPLQDLKICGGYSFRESQVQAIRLDAAPGSERNARVFKKNDFDPLTGRRRIVEIGGCRPEGELRIDSLIAGPKTFPLSSVTQIQLPWIPH